MKDTSDNRSHPKDGMPNKPEELIAAGATKGDHNKDNSVEENFTTVSNCKVLEIPVPPPNPPPTPPAPPAPGPDVAAQTATATLPVTGSANGPLVAVGLGMLALGGIALWGARRRTAAAVDIDG